MSAALRLIAEADIEDDLDAELDELEAQEGVICRMLQSRPRPHPYRSDEHWAAATEAMASNLSDWPSSARQLTLMQLVLEDAIRVGAIRLQ